MIEERKKLEEEIREGKIFSTISSNGIGRGTAMTLPAWMTEVVFYHNIIIREMHQFIQIKSLYIIIMFSQTIQNVHNHRFIDFNKMSIPGAAVVNIPC